MLSPEQVERYRGDGFLVLPGLVDDEWLRRLREVTAEFVERSRAAPDDWRFSRERDHTADRPRLLRLTSPTDQHATY